MARMTGKNLFVSFGGVTISNDYTSFEDGIEIETTDATAGDDDFRNFLKTVKKIAPKIKIICKDRASGSAINAALIEGTEGTLLWGAEGTATGKPKWGGLFGVMKSPQSMKYDGLDEIDVEFYLAEQSGGTLLFDGRSASW